MEIDDLDRRILVELAEDANRRSRKSIARKLKISEPSLSRRIERLCRNGVLRRFTIEIDYQRLGFLTDAVTRLKVSSPQVMRKIEKYLSGVDEAIYVAQISGRWDLLVFWRTRNNAELVNLARRLSEMGAEETELEVIFAPVKGQFG